MLSRLLVVCGFALSLAGGPAPASAESLAGLWRAKHVFGPDARGTLLLTHTPAGWEADMAGRIVPVRTERGELRFDLPNALGGFHGRLGPGGDIVGHWYAPPSAANLIGATLASPVRLRPDGPGRWRGEVAPQDDTFSFFLRLSPKADGTMAALARNPERDYGAFRGVDRLAQDAGKSVV